MFVSDGVELMSSFFFEDLSYSMLDAVGGWEIMDNFPIFRDGPVDIISD